MQAQRIQRTPAQQFVTLTLVAGIHVVAIAALVVALNPGIMTHPRPDGPIEMIPPHETPPPPTRPDINPTLITPGPSESPPRPPWIDTDNGPSITAPPGRTGNDTGPIQPPHQIALTPVRPIFGTHSTPDYPPIAARLNEQGSVRLQLGIDEQGIITDASVITSSGYEALDRAAIAWVKAHWRYAPATRDGVPIPASTSAVVTFRLTNRQG
jgi:protein TonB